MILILNGSFGAGKMTVAHFLKRRIAGSLVDNPEWAGSILLQLSAFIKFRGAGTDDFQDTALWRQSVVSGTKICRALARDTVIAPMAFSRRDYLDEIVGGMRRFDERIEIYCLKAAMPTILERLERLAQTIHDDALLLAAEQTEQHEIDDRIETIKAAALLNEIFREHSETDNKPKHTNEDQRKARLIALQRARPDYQTLIAARRSLQT